MWPQLVECGRNDRTPHVLGGFEPGTWQIAMTMLSTEARPNARMPAKVQDTPTCPPKSQATNKQTSLKS